MAEKVNKGRREFFKKSGKYAGLFLALPIASGLIGGCERDEVAPGQTGESIIVNISGHPELEETGAMKSIPPQGKFGGRALNVYRQSPGSFIVYTSVCTHQGCTVHPPFGSENFMSCECHGATYLIADGSVNTMPTDGVATTLPRYKNEFNPQSNMLTIYDEQIIPEV